MRICPKCRNFYADATLKFCPADGVPLAGIDPTSNLWPKGTEAVRQTARRIQKQIRRQKLKRVVSMTVTTVLAVMVVSVVALNSYIYLNPEEKEIAQALPSTPTPVIDTVSETATPGVEETPSPTPVSWVDAIFGTPTPTPTPDGGGGGPPLTPTPSPRETSTPPLTPTPTPPPTPSGCSFGDKGLAILAIRSGYFNAWKNEIRGTEEGAKKRFYSESKYPALVAEASLSFSMFSPAIVPDNECKTASVTINYAWRVVNTEGENKKYGGSRSYQCVNNGGKWACSQ
jgi:hypothetical protein